MVMVPVGECRVLQRMKGYALAWRFRSAISEGGHLRVGVRVIRGRVMYK